MTLRLPDDVHERLRRQAFEERTSINALVLAALTSAQPDEVPTADRLAGWLNEHPELTGVTDGTRFVGTTPAQPVRDTEKGRR